MNQKNLPRSRDGFTLVEIAIVLLIVTLLMTGLVPTITSQIEQRQVNETRKQLDEIQQALIGFAVAKGRLPCPATAASNGVESYVGTEGESDCSSPYGGFVPALTLGITSTTDNQGNKGYAVDPWGNRIRYAVTTSNSSAFTTNNGMKTTGITTLNPNLLVCSEASTSSTSCSVANSSLATGVPIVIFSTGKNGTSCATCIDETENNEGTDRVFVSHVPAPASATNGEFDDIVIWVSGNLIINRMVVAGQLP